MEPTLIVDSNKPRRGLSYLGHKSLALLAELMHFGRVGSQGWLRDQLVDRSLDLPEQLDLLPTEKLAQHAAMIAIGKNHDSRGARCSRDPLSCRKALCKRILLERR